MNAPFLARMAGCLGERLVGKRLRYVLRRARGGARGTSPPDPVYLLRMEPPAGTLLVSLRRDLPAAVLLGEGESPRGENDAGAAKLGDLLAERPVSRVFAPDVDRVLVLEWEGGVATRLDLIPPRPVLYVIEHSSVKLVLPERAAARTKEAASERPGSARPDVLHFDPETIPDGLSTEEEARAFFRRAIRAIPGEWPDEVLARARFGDAPAAESRAALIDAWRDVVAEFLSSDRAFLYRTESRRVLSPVSIRGMAPDPGEFPDFLEAGAAWWKESDEAIRLHGTLSELRGAAVRERKRLLRLLDKRRAELAGAKHAPLYRKQAEILSIHFRDVAKGASFVRLPDPYEGAEIEIPLDPAMSARRNIERLFQRAKRGERGAEIVAGKIVETERLLASIDSILNESESVTSADAAELLSEKAGPLLRKIVAKPAWRESIRKPRDRNLPVRPREYRIAGGYTVLVGRDNKENDRLTLKIARPGDLWFHAAQAAGSHVVLLREDPARPVPGDALLVAAAIAAWHSKAKHGSKVAVVYTERRHVRKPRGWPPGKVTCTREKTLFVEPGVPEKKE